MFLAFIAALACAVFVATDADAAKRLGGGSSMGTQRNMNTAPAGTPAKPAQAAPQQSQAAPAAAQPAPASGFARWAPLLGGLALGGALGWLMGANGMGGMLVGMMLVGLLVFAVVVVVRMLAQKRGETAPQRMQYAGLGMGSETVAAPPPSQASGLETQTSPLARAVANVPPGFDVAGFLRSAKMNYMKLQLANDRGDLDELREFTSPELFEELKRDVLARAGATQQTDVLALNADLLEVATEGDKHWASVRFSGTIRESASSAPAGFEEVWNLAKPADGSTGWTLAGIQQMH
jgi:predicted lipid-binding transport protein (Tim44 family)